MSTLGNLFLRSIPVILFITLACFPLHAQRGAGAVGIGAQFGNPTGLSIKVYQPTGISTDILAAWDLNDFFYLNIHGLYERHIGNSQHVHFFAGPGFFVGLRDRNGAVEGFGKDGLAAGISGSLGLNVVIGVVELYGQFTPRLELVDRTDAEIGGGVGLRFYFR